MRDRMKIQSDRRDDSGKVQPPERMLFLAVEVLLDIRDLLLETSLVKNIDITKMRFDVEVPDGAEIMSGGDTDD